MLVPYSIIVYHFMWDPQQWTRPNLRLIIIVCTSPTVETASLNNFGTVSPSNMIQNEQIWVIMLLWEEKKKHPQTSISKKTMANKPNRWARWCSTLQRRGTSLNLPFTSDTVSPAIGNKSAFLSLPWSHGTIIPGDPRNHNNPDDVYWGRPAWYLHRG
jgi:hypothetical protein